jgi:hypothetical protein
LKLALIPPRSLEGYIRQSDGIQLALAIPEYMDNQGMKNELALASRFKDHIILDNGAAEGARMLDGGSLLEIAHEFGAAEIVAPDVMGKSNETIQRVTKFMSDWGSAIRGAFGLKVMAVAQGVDQEDAAKTIKAYKSMEHSFGHINVVGIPRHLIGSYGDTIRLELAEFAANLNFEVHLLGTNPLWIEEVREAGKLPFIRSCDTSAPFNYAIEGVQIAEGMQEAVTRPDGYFKLFWASRVDGRILRSNVNTLKEWAHGN